MAKAGQQLLLDLPPSAVERIIKTAVAELGWKLTGEPDGRLIVDEEVTKLPCHCSPLHAELELRPVQGGQQTKVDVTGRVPGWGPVASQHVRGQTDLITRRVGLAAIAVAKGREPSGEPR